MAVGRGKKQAVGSTLASEAGTELPGAVGLGAGKSFSGWMFTPCLGEDNVCATVSASHLTGVPSALLIPRLCRSVLKTRVCSLTLLPHLFSVLLTLAEGRMNIHGPSFPSFG